jgi:hypothetical protein
VTGTQPTRGFTWRKSSLSGASGDCVEVAFTDGQDVCVRDSKDPSGPVLEFTPTEWRAFLAGVRHGEFDG